MEFSEAEKTVFIEIAQKHSTNIIAAIAMAYEAGMLMGAQRVAQNLALKSLETPVTTSNNDEDDGPDGVTATDAAWLRAQGIDPNKKFRVKNSVFTIVAVKRSRWKFPISAINQNGTRYKWTIPVVKSYQAATR